MVGIAVGFITGQNRVRVKRIACTLVLVVFVALTTVGATPALADTTINGCTNVAQTTATHFTNCP